MPQWIVGQLGCYWSHQQSEQYQKNNSRWSWLKGDIKKYISEVQNWSLLNLFKIMKQSRLCTLDGCKQSDESRLSAYAVQQLSRWILKMEYAIICHDHSDKGITWRFAGNTKCWLITLGKWVSWIEHTKKMTKKANELHGSFTSMKLLQLQGISSTWANSKVYFQFFLYPETKVQNTWKNDNWSSYIV